MTTSTTTLPYWLTLLRTPNIGPVKFLEIIKYYPDDLIENYFVENNLKINWESIQKDLDWSEQPQNHILAIHSPHYPPRLLEISAPPPLLFVSGDINLLTKSQLAMVGSRNPTPTGEDIAFQFSKAFSQAGLVITSGLALGIDAACHEGVLANQGETVAVLGTGPDIIYPKRHINLAHKILERGCIVTEFPTGITPIAANFPRRNRIISGLSLGVLVIEAAYASGSLVTAKYALEQNREVFAIPGSIHNPLSRGCHLLIKQGAKLVETVEDILEELQGGLRTPTPPQKTPTQLPLPDFVSHIGFETTPVDLLISRSGLTAEEVSSILLVLELDGLIKSVPGGYVRIK